MDCEEERRRERVVQGAAASGAAWIARRERGLSGSGRRVCWRTFLPLSRLVISVTRSCSHMASRREVHTVSRRREEAGARTLPNQNRHPAGRGTLFLRDSSSEIRGRTPDETTHPRRLPSPSPCVLAHLIGSRRGYWSERSLHWRARRQLDACSAKEGNAGDFAEEHGRSAISGP